MKRNSFMQILFVPVVILIFCHLPAFGLGEENIRLNQIGFYQYGPKIAIVVTQTSWRFAVKSPDLNTTYFTGQLSQPKRWDASAETVAVADFSDFSRPGTYVLDVGGAGVSYPFRIDASVHEGLVRGLIRSFYYQRASTSLPSQYAGRWSRSAGHPDLHVIVHSSAESDPTAPNPRKAGDVFPSPGGWYDAGDYGKYVVNAGISVYTLLALYEQFPAYFDTFPLNIPRPISGLPDLLTEIKWELDWLLTMQDPSDGSVYHKLTTLDFSAFIMPEQDKSDRYFIGKGSAAAFDFSALCAVAYRIYKKTLPGFADSCLAAGKRAFEWGHAHPNVGFINPDDVKTGAYGDGTFWDEQNWAAHELTLSTGDTAFRAAVAKINVSYGVPGWPNVAMLGMYSLMHLMGDSAATTRILSQAKPLGVVLDASPYRTIPSSSGDFYWGSNGVAANYGMLFIEAFLATKDASYFDRAVHVLDYCLGRNALGYCFVTGFGSKYPRYPHHRPSSADGIAEPIPGFLVGGPNRNLVRDDGNSCGAGAYGSNPPAKSWIESECSYGSNEVAINWNAPLAFLAGAIEAIYTNPAFNVQKYAIDTLPPVFDSIAISGLTANCVTISWNTDKDVSASVEYAPDSGLTRATRLFSKGTTRHSVLVCGLAPSTRYYFRLKAIDDIGAAVNSPVRTFVTLESKVFQGFSLSSVAAMTIGADVAISFAAAPGLSGSLSYSIGGDARTHTVPCTENNGAYGATIPGTDVTASGILYSITLAKATDTLTTPMRAISPATPVTFSYVIPRAWAYALVVPPFSSPISQSYGFFNQQLGDSSLWRYLSYDASAGKYVSHGAMGGGHGGWLLASEAKTLSVETSVPKPDTLFPITLAKGWNCIGNPFPYPVYWENSLVRFQGSEVRLFDGAARQLIRRQVFWYSDTSGDRMNNGQYFSNRTILPSDSTRLLPWQGYWVYAEKNGVELLANPAAARPTMPMAKKTDQGEKQWQTVFSLMSNGTSDAAFIGEAPWASDGYDEFDSPKLPAISTTEGIGLIHADWQTKATFFTADIANYSEKKTHEWQLALFAGPGRQNLILSWQTSGTINGFLYLQDAVAGALIDMGGTNTYAVSFLPGQTGRIVSIQFSALADKRFKSMPATWSLHQNAPNPFRAATIITYSIPGIQKGEIRPRAVHLTVFDVSGRRVRTLANGAANPGTYSVVWDGTDDGHVRLRQGMYIVHCRADGFSGSIKTHLFD
jgi:endoglucanase